MRVQSANLAGSSALVLGLVSREIGRVLNAVSPSVADYALGRIYLQLCERHLAKFRSTLKLERSVNLESAFGAADQLRSNMQGFSHTS